MPTQCRLVDPKELRERGERLQPGDMWYAPWLIMNGDGTTLTPEEVYSGPNSYLSRKYRDMHFGKRAPLMVRLPDGTDWCLDGRSTDSTEGWLVTGEPPHITAEPSIHLVGRYHGFLKAGVLTDDLEGRTYYFKNGCWGINNVGHRD